MGSPRACSVETNSSSDQDDDDCAMLVDDTDQRISPAGSEGHPAMRSMMDESDRTAKAKTSVTVCRSVNRLEIHPTYTHFNLSS